MFYVLIIAAYLVGSIPFGFLIAKVFGVGDIRTKGSGNIGATNVLRSVGIGAGAATFLLDFLKGTIMVLLALWFVDPLAAVGVGVAAVVGHVFPIFLRFRGGKGVAVAAGVFMALCPAAVLGVLGIFALVVLTTRIVSLASLLASGAFPLLAWLLGAPGEVVWSGAIVVALIFLRHTGNIERLVRGKESRFAGKKGPRMDETPAPSAPQGGAGGSVTS